MSAVGDFMEAFPLWTTSGPWDGIEGTLVWRSKKFPWLVLLNDRSDNPHFGEEIQYAVSLHFLADPEDDSGAVVFQAHGNDVAGMVTAVRERLFTAHGAVEILTERGRKDRKERFENPTEEKVKRVADSLAARPRLLIAVMRELANRKLRIANAWECQLTGESNEKINDTDHYEEMWARKPVAAGTGANFAALVKVAGLDYVKWELTQDLTEAGIERGNEESVAEAKRVVDERLREFGWTLL